MYFFGDLVYDYPHIYFQAKLYIKIYKPAECICKTTRDTASIFLFPLNIPIGNCEEE